MENIINYLTILGLLSASNILIGLYYNVNIKDFDFDVVKFFNGVIKAVIIIFSFVSLYYTFYQIPELTEAVGFNPQVIMTSAIVLYVTKVGLGLGNILGIKLNSNKE